jgi:hypothetical protein
MGFVKGVKESDIFLLWKRFSIWSVSFGVAPGWITIYIP